MKRNDFRGRLAAVLILAAIALQPGCRTAPVIPPPVTPPAPSLPKTFGEAVVDGSAVTILFKDMRILVDPSPGVLTQHGATADFILFTCASAVAGGPYRAGQKALGPNDAVEAARAAGLSGFKSLAPGQRLMVSKNQAFAFVSVARGKTPSGQMSNGYLLEFDNGRNVVVLARMDNADPVREFVYGLRDDGKEVQLGFFGVEERGGEATAGDLAALIQPQIAVFTGAKGADRAAIKTALETGLFNGDWRVANDREPLPF